MSSNYRLIDKSNKNQHNQSIQNKMVKKTKKYTYITKTTLKQKQLLQITKKKACNYNAYSLVLINNRK